MRIPFCGPTYLGRSTNINSEKCVNFFPEADGSGNARASLALVGVPGTKTFSTPSVEVPRGMYNCDGYLYVVLGDSLYSISPSGVPSLWLGRLNDSTGEVLFADNGVSKTGTIGGGQMMLLSNGIGYIYNTATGILTQITDPVFMSILNPMSLTYQDGYFIVAESSQRFFVSNFYDGTTWGALAWASATTTSDNIQVAISLNQTLYVIKSWSTEAFYNAGTPTTQGSPFVRVSGAVFPYGTVAPLSVAYGLDSVFFLANQGHGSSSEFTGVVMMQGYTPSVISPPAITYLISELTTLTDARGYFYADEGHGFYVLTFPTDDLTLVYDITTKLWHERSTSQMTDAFQHRHLGQHYANCYGKHLLTDYRGGSIKEMSSRYYDDDGVPIKADRISPILYDPDEDRSLHIHRMTLEVESGVGLLGVTTDSNYSWVLDGSKSFNGGAMDPADPLSFNYLGGYYLVPASDTTPTAWLSWSNDSGHTWSNEYAASMGRLGEYRTRLVWRGLGKARNRVFKLSMKNRVKKVVLDATVQADV